MSVEMNRFQQLIFQCEMRGMTRSTELDQFMPVHQFSEYHSTRVDVPAERVYQAVRSVTAADIFFSAPLPGCGVSAVLGRKAS